MQEMGLEYILSKGGQTKLIFMFSIATKCEENMKSKRVLSNDFSKSDAVQNFYNTKMLHSIRFFVYFIAVF
jgi:hypothetical protein